MSKGRYFANVVDARERPIARECQDESSEALIFLRKIRSGVSKSTLDSGSRVFIEDFNKLHTAKTSSGNDKRS